MSSEIPQNVEPEEAVVSIDGSNESPKNVQPEEVLSIDGSNKSPLNVLPNDVIFIDGSNTEDKYYGFYPLSAQHPVLYDGRKYLTADHLYHAIMFMHDPNCDDIVEEIRLQEPDKQPRPSVVGYSFFVRPDWYRVKYKMMNEVLIAKFIQNVDIGNLLRDTGDKEIVLIPDKHFGNCWSIGVTGKGENNLGKMLMKLRKQPYFQHPS